MNTIGERVFLDPRRRHVSVGGKTTELQEKPWQVLTLLTGCAPEVVTREAIIDQVWSGNFLTGDKGLNQVLWTIRAALGDDAREPRFIRTIPRVGYQWIAEPVTTQRQASSPRYRWALAASLASVATAITLIAGNFSNVSPIRDSVASPVSVAPDGTRAYLQDQAIVVDMASGCQRIVKPDQANMELGNPALSSDGKHVVFPVRQGNECKIVTLELENGARRDYGSCSVSLT